MGHYRRLTDASMDSDHALSIPGGDRTARDAKAVAYLRATGNDDLLEVLGLDGAEPRSGNPLSVACPTCGADAGARCKKQYVEGTKQRHHQARYRIVGRERV